MKPPDKDDIQSAVRNGIFEALAWLAGIAVVGFLLWQAWNVAR